MHHVAAVNKVLTAFHSMLHPGGILCLADLDSDHGLFHLSEIAESVRHNGFDREELKGILYPIGFKESIGVTAHSIRKAGAYWV